MVSIRALTGGAARERTPPCYYTSSNALIAFTVDTRVRIIPLCEGAKNMRVVQKALTFDDVLLIPAHSTVLPREVSLKTRLTRNITLNIPVVSAAMDTVTEARLAIAIAQEGGIGIVHKNMSPKAQAAEVTKVKRFESGIVKDPDHRQPPT